MRERERAEQLWQKLTRLEAAQDAQDIYIAREYVDLIVAFSREERARAYEEAAYYLEYRSSGPIPPDAIDHMKDCAKHLREEGGNHVQDRRTRENRRVRL